jgi:hypothetical protein
MTVILFGWPMVRLASSSRSPSRSRAARLVEDEVIAEFGLGEKEAMLATSLFTFAFVEERSKGCQPFLTAGQYIASR